MDHQNIVEIMDIKQSLLGYPKLLAAIRISRIAFLSSEYPLLFYDITKTTSVDIQNNL